MKLYRTNDTVNSKEQEVLDTINQYPGLNSSKIAKLIGKSTSTTKRYLNSLVRLGIFVITHHYLHEPTDYRIVDVVQRIL